MNNYANRFLLWCFLLPSGIYRRFGADMAQLKAILITKLTIDDRTATGLYKARNRNDDEGPSFATVITMVIALVMGLLFSFVFAIDDDLSRMTMYFTIFGFMLSMFLITDFSHILVDVKDNYIILPKPVSSQTFLLARLIHIIIHVSKILIPLAFPAWIAMWISRGAWGAVVFIPVMLLLTMLTFTVVNAVYLLIMQVFTPARINSIITTLQIAFSIILYGGFQLLSRIIGESFLEEIDLSEYKWLWVFPSFWMASAWTYLYSFATEPVYIIGTILSIVVPIIGVWVMIRFLAPAFFRKLSMISVGTETEHRKESRETGQQGIIGFVAKLGMLLTRQGIEREAFIFTWRMTGRSRDFKLKVYPQIGYMIILIVIFLLGGKGINLEDSLDLSSSGAKRRVLLYMYLSCIVYIAALYQLPYHSQPKAAWIYFSPPLSRPGFVLIGAIKACMAKFFFPIVLLLTITGILLFGPVIIPNLLFGFGNVFLACALFAWVAMNKLPFSMSLKMAAEGQSSIRNFFMLLAFTLFGLPHYFLFDFHWVVLLLSFVTITAGYFVLSNIRNISWGYVSGA